MPCAGKFIKTETPKPIKPKWIKLQKHTKKIIDSETRKILKQSVSVFWTAKEKLPAFDSICNSFTQKINSDKEKATPNESDSGEKNRTETQTIKGKGELIKNG